MKNYVYAYSNADNKACVIEKIRVDLRPPKNSHNKELSPKLLMTIDPSFGNELHDVIRDSKFSFIVSKRLKEFLDNENLINNGFIPATIVNETNRIIAKSYFVAHQTIHQNCINMEKSIFDRDPRKYNSIISVDHLVVDESLIDSRV